MTTIVFIFSLSMACRVRAHLVAKIRSPGYINAAARRERREPYYGSTFQQCSAFPLFSAKPYQRVQLCKFSVMCAKTSSSFSSVCLKVACNFANYVEMHAFTSRKQQHFKLLWFALIRPTFAKRTDSTTQWSAILKKNWTI